jgi:hypothetical protein
MFFFIIYRTYIKNSCPGSIKNGIFLFFPDLFIEGAGGMISGYKSAYIWEGLHKVTFVYDIEGRHPVTEKVRWIVEWPACRSIKEARAFVGLWLYYRAWIWDFSVVVEPIFRLFRRSRVTAGDSTNEPTLPTRWGGKLQRRKVKELENFTWGLEQKEALVPAPALIPLV